MGVFATLEMSTGRLFVLAAIAGFTIFLGLPLGRLRNPAPRVRVALNGMALRILALLPLDVPGHATGPGGPGRLGGGARRRRGAR